DKPDAKKVQFVLPSLADNRPRPLRRREELSRALIEHDLFARAMVNRMWSVFFGRVIIDNELFPGDGNNDLHASLLDELASRFKDSDYDLKALVRLICNSEVYQLSSVVSRDNLNPEVEALFGRMPIKALSPEQLFASLMTATGAQATE